jgi:hypothetical protein
MYLGVADVVFNDDVSKSEKETIDDHHDRIDKRTRAFLIDLLECASGQATDTRIVHE